MEGQVEKYRQEGYSELLSNIGQAMANGRSRAAVAVNSAMVHILEDRSSHSGI